jgi:hypothetical protein
LHRALPRLTQNHIQKNSNPELNSRETKGAFEKCDQHSQIKKTFLHIN